MVSLQQKRRQLRRVRIRNIIINVVCIMLVLCGISWTAAYFWRYANYEVTNDAFIDQYIAPVNIRVAGYVKEVRFKEHQYVHRGDTLLILDDEEYRIKVMEAQAALLDAEGSNEVLHSGIRTSATNVDVQQANIDEAKAKLWQAEQDYRRYQKLLEEESVAQQQFEQAKATYESAKARYEALIGQQRMARSQFTETNRKQKNMKAAIMSRQAALKLARLNLSYTVVTAPYAHWSRGSTFRPVRH